VMPRKSLLAKQSILLVKEFCFGPNCSSEVWNCWHYYLIEVQESLFLALWSTGEKALSIHNLLEDHDLFLLWALAEQSHYSKVVQSMECTHSIMYWYSEMLVFCSLE
jgi:hypothetical protein